jgi:hypothetical protein
MISVGENFLVVVDRVDDAGWTEPVEVATGVRADHCFNVAQLGALLDGATTPYPLLICAGEQDRGV